MKQNLQYILLGSLLALVSIASYEALAPERMNTVAEESGVAEEDSCEAYTHNRSPIFEWVLRDNPQSFEDFKEVSDVVVHARLVSCGVHPRDISTTSNNTKFYYEPVEVIKGELSSSRFPISFHVDVGADEDSYSVAYGPEGSEVLPSSGQEVLLFLHSYQASDNGETEYGIAVRNSGIGHGIEGGDGLFEFEELTWPTEQPTVTISEIRSL